MKISKNLKEDSSNDSYKRVIAYLIPNINIQNDKLLLSLIEYLKKTNSVNTNTIKRKVGLFLGITKTTSSPTSVKYWEIMGWENRSVEMAEIHKTTARELMKIYHQNCRKNPNLYKLKSKMSVEFWKTRGFTEDEAKRQISKLAKNAYRGLVSYKKKNPHTETTRLSYWINKGFSKKEAKEKLSERQSTFSYDKCVKKFGKEKGYLVWLERQKKWQRSLEKSGYIKIRNKRERSEFQNYKNKVWSYTKLQPISSLDNFEKRGKNIRKSYHLDHIFSMYEGFKNGIDAKIIGNIVNLRFIPAKENLVKHSSSKIDKESLLKLYEEYNEK